jgi:L-lactate dehydrogenase (cytochrome)
VRSGLDVLKAVASGADACLIGRAWAYALGAGGERGVSQLLETIRSELRTALALAGCTDIGKAGADLLANPTCAVVSGRTEHDTPWS